MIIRNKLDKSFGPTGSVAGYIIFIVGLGSTIYSWTGLILALIGAFAGFTSTSTVIDLNTKRVKFSNNLFGIIKTGKWISIEPTMKLGIKKINKVWRTYSGSNRSFDFPNKDYRIMLYSSDNKVILPIKKANSLEGARVELEALGNQLGLASNLT